MSLDGIFDTCVGTIIFWKAISFVLGMVLLLVMLIALYQSHVIHQHKIWQWWE